MTTPSQAERLLTEFPEHTYDQWHAAAEALLKGAPFEKALVSKTHEDITIQPIYRRDDIVGLLVAETGKPLENAEYDFEMLPTCLRFFAEEVQRLRGEIIPDSDGTHVHVASPAASPVGPAALVAGLEIAVEQQFDAILANDPFNIVHLDWQVC